MRLAERGLGLRRPAQQTTPARTTSRHGFVRSARHTGWMRTPGMPVMRPVGCRDFRVRPLIAGSMVMLFGLGGLLFATFATLVFVPTMYRLLRRAGRSAAISHEIGDANAPA